MRLNVNISRADFWNSKLGNLDDDKGNIRFHGRV